MGRYADAFHVDCHTRLEAIEENTKTKLTVVASLVWDKQTILKSKIETESINGMRKYYDVVEKELQSYIKPANDNSKSQLNQNGFAQMSTTTYSDQGKSTIYSFDERTILVAFI